MSVNENKVKELQLELTPAEEANLEEQQLVGKDSIIKPSFELEKDYRTARIVGRIITYTFLTIFALFMLLPFWFMLVVSVKPPTEYLMEVSTGLKLFTKNPSFVNFKIIFGSDISSLENLLPDQFFTDLGLGKIRKINFLPFFLNTTIVAVVSTLFTVATTVLASFAFARLEFKAKNFLFSILLATMMVPGEMMLITNVQTALSLDWENTFAALIFVHGVSVFYIFYLRQTFQQIPNELFLAAKVDGYGEFKYLWRVMLPIGMPTIVTIIILNVMGSWNAYIWPSLIATGTNPVLKDLFNIEHSMLLVSNGIMDMFKSGYGDYPTMRIAGSMVISAPILVVFMIFRKYIMSGVSRSGIKG